MRGVIMQAVPCNEARLCQPSAWHVGAQGNPRSIGRLSVIQAVVILFKPQGIIRTNTVSDCSAVGSASELGEGYMRAGKSKKKKKRGGEGGGGVRQKGRTCVG